MLDLESFSFLTRALESPLAPLVILASNRGMTPIHVHSSNNSFPAPGLQPTPHGIPPDMLARLLIIPTHQYNPSEITSIIRTRARTEGVIIADAALNKVADIGAKVSLRYALQLLAPAQVLARVKVGAPAGTPKGEVSVADVEECEGLFLDGARSAQGLTGAAGFLV